MINVRVDEDGIVAFTVKFLTVAEATTWADECQRASRHLSIGMPIEDWATDAEDNEYECISVGVCLYTHKLTLGEIVCELDSIYRTIHIDNPRVVQSW